MNDYKAVSSGLEISRRIADCLEEAAAVSYLPNERTCAIRAVNDILQGRSTRTVEELLAELEKCGEGRIVSVRQDIQDFLRQKELLAQTYDKRWNGKQYTYERSQGIEGRRLKVIDQKLYDHAARQGFPPDFFRESYFDRVTFYCLPKFADFLGSELHNCKFAVCRITSVSFVLSHIYDTEFYSSILNHVDLCASALAHTRFRDCELSHVMLQTAKLKSCSTIDCTMDVVDYAGATLDGCSFDRVTAGTIRLDHAIITQGGATEEECRRNREAIYQALGIKEDAA